MKKYKIMAVLFFLLVILVNPHIATAEVDSEDEFKTEYEVTYDIDTNNLADVTQKIRITNLKNDIIATNYTLSLKQMKIFDIEAYDERGKMEIIQEEENGAISIKALFNDNVIGKGRNNEFTFKYKTNDLASKVGEIYNIKIPQVSGITNIREYNVILKVPSNFGPKIFITPKPTDEKNENNKLIYYFSKTELEKSGISANFGRYQLINYHLTYQIENTHIFAVIQEIALPPDIKQRQQVNHSGLNPKPYLLKEDLDGNLIAYYKLKPKEKLEIKLTGTAKIMGDQILIEHGGKFKDIPNNLKDLYTKKQKYWEIDDPKIQYIKNKLYDSEQNIAQNAYNIYQFIIENFKYDFEIINKDSVQRMGALNALESTNPITCMEFTDIFISIARAMGIPTREINGYAINTTQDKNLPLSIKFNSTDQLHSWVEFYDPNFGWVPIDPTWGNTSKLDYFTRLDNNHFVFVIKGVNSEYPLPAGSYRYNDGDKLISVELTQNSSDQSYDYFPALFKTINFNLIKIIKGYEKFYVKNEGGTYIYNFYGLTKLLPYQSRPVYIPKNTSLLTFNDINNTIIEKNIIYLNKNPIKLLVPIIPVILSFLLGIGLYSFLYYFLILKGGLKKLRDRLHRHHQDPNQ